MKNSLKFLLLGFFFIAGIIIYTSFYCDYYKDNEKQNEMVAIFIESDKLNEKGEKVYEVGDSSSLNNENYSINEELSSCQNGEKFIYDESTKSYSISVYGQDKCDIYLDKKTVESSSKQDSNPNTFTEEEPVVEGETETNNDNETTNAQ